MLDHDDRIAMVAKPVQHGQQHLDVGNGARRRFVEDIERAPGVAFESSSASSRAAPLTRQRRRRLAKRDVAQPDVEQRRELARDGRYRLENA